MKKLGHVFIAIVLLISMCGCTTDTNNAVTALDKGHSVVVQNDLEVFSGGDISKITERIFDVSPDEISADASNNGIIADLFANAQVQITSADNTTISYTIVSPDISDFFTAYADQLDSITTSEELGQAILEYAKAAPTKEYTVTVPYFVEEDDIDVAYDDPDFINAMTGGLLDAYTALYDLYLSEG